MAGLGSLWTSRGSGEQLQRKAPSSFPNGFLWGTATAAYQVEGGVHEGGRGPSIWDQFSQQAGKVANGDTGEVADDFFHRYREDVHLMASMGIQAFRFSVSWTRVFPQGSGQPLAGGLDFYKRLVAELQAAGIEPFCTLYHWDLPQALQDRGGWENIETAHRLADYSGYVAGQLGGAGVSRFMTMNEIRTFVENGYGSGRHAPGLKVDRKRLAQLTHHALLGHGLSVQSMRASTRAGTSIGIAENATACVPITETAADTAAAKIAMREQNAAYLTAVCEGGYTRQYLKRLGPDAPDFTPEQMRIIASPLDWVGLNVYTAAPCRASTDARGYEMLPVPKDYPRMASSWLTVGPESLYWAPRLAHELWQPKAIFITENGCSADDSLTPHGEVLDTGRVMYLRNYLTQLQRSVAEGVPVQGYFCWSLLDNFEWADGYSKRFGIIYVDFKTQKRTPKLSAAFYQSVIAENKVT